MRYAINTERVGYQRIDFNTKINFDNDTLFFKNIRDAYKYLYYAKNNKFEILVTPNIVKNLSLLKILLLHNATIKFYKANDSAKSSLVYHYIKNQVKLYRKSDIKFCPKVYEIHGESETIYTLEGYVINDISADYYGSAIYGYNSLADIPIKYQLQSTEQKFEVVDSEYKLGANSEEFRYSLFNSEIVKNVFKPKLYVYACKVINNQLYISIFLQGYTHFNLNYEVITESNYEILPNTDWVYYSKKANLFKKNFITLKLEDVDTKFKFSYNGRNSRVYFTRGVQSGSIVNDLVLINNTYSVDVSSNIEGYKDSYYSKIEGLQATNNEQFYLFQDRVDRADDNAEALYQYYMEHTDIKIYFVLEQNCQCWNRLKKKGYDLVAFGSDRHKQLFLTASKIISSHAARRIYDPFYPSKKYANLEKSKFVFLQHGIIMGKHHGFLDIVNNDNVDLIISSTDDEAKLITSFSGYNNVQPLGLARFDKYSEPKTTNNQNNFIIYAPSWNVKYKDNLENSEYVEEIEKVLNSEQIYKTLNKAKMELYLILHPEFIKHNICFENKFNHRIFKQTDFLYSDMLSNTTALITDYSSLFFDILYQNKLVIQHKPYELHHKNDSLTGYQDALYESDNINQLEKLIESLQNAQFKISAHKKKVISSFFKYHDNNNCHRNYEAIEKL